MEEIVDHYGDDPDMKYERSTVDMILKVFKQMESTIMKSAELQGFVKQPTQTTNIAIVESTVSERVDNILGIIKDAPICDDCKILILDELEDKGFL
jgi:hydrogenase maturation factor HypF (carbamoyltransferase family)